MRTLVLALGLWIQGPQVLQAAEQSRVLESSRALGRGDTYVAAYDSDEATRSNPATMVESNTKFQVRWLQLDFFLGDNSINSFNQISKIDQTSSAVGMLETFKDKFGKRQYGRVEVAPLAMRFGNFEIMPFATTSNFVDMRDPPLPEVEFESDSMVGVAFSYARELSKTLSLGLTLRPASRTQFAGNIAFSDLLKFVDNSNFQLQNLFTERQGTQIGTDLGLVYKPGAAWRFGLLVENLGYAGNYGAVSANPLPPYQQRVNLGSNYRVDYKPWHWDMLFDVQDIVNPQHYNFWRLLHAGTEFGRSYISRDNDVGLLAGINEGYFTTGGYLDFIVARLNISYYAVELGEIPGQRKDRRWGATLLSSTTF